MGAKSTQNSASKAGASRHFAKMKVHVAQIKGQGAMTGGFATSPGAPVVPNPMGKMASKGKC